VTPVSDTLTDGAVVYTIITTATSTDPAFNNANIADVTVTNNDQNDSPVITSVTITPATLRINQPVTFTVAASDPEGQPLTITFDYGDGSTDDLGQHAFATPQDYTVTITVSDGINTINTTRVVTITDPAAPDADPDHDGQVNSVDTDDDNDGFRDELENGLNTDPVDATSTPFGGQPAGTPSALTISKMSIALNFAKPGNDAVAISGILHIPANFNPAQKVAIDVGGVIKSFQLTSKGASVKVTGSTNSFKLTVKAVKGVVAEQDAKFQAKLSKGIFASKLTDEQLTNSDQTKLPVTVKVNVLLNKTVYTTDRTLSYTAKKFKSGKAQ